MFICMHVNRYMQYACICICSYVCLFVCLCVYVYVCM